MGNKRSLLIWEIIGAIFIMVVGSLLHFTFKWSDYSKLVGVVSAVNESVWEHLKLGFWSLVFFSVIEYTFIKRKANNFLAAKALGIVVMQLFIVVFFYSYTAITGSENLTLDIISYIIGAVICQIISYRLLTNRDLGNKVGVLGLIILILHGVVLTVFTFYPPKLPIFKDSNSNSYGITYHDHKDH